MPGPTRTLSPLLAYRLPSLSPSSSKSGDSSAFSSPDSSAEGSFAFSAFLSVFFPAAFLLSSFASSDGSPTAVAVGTGSVHGAVASVSGARGSDRDVASGLTGVNVGVTAAKSGSARSTRPLSSGSSVAPATRPTTASAVTGASARRRPREEALRSPRRGAAGVGSTRASSSA